MDRKIILVDANDNQIGLEEKIKTHKEGILHRAISVYLFNSKGELMLQQRAAGTYHSGMLWSNTCCSNCYEEESAEFSAHRALKSEMDIECEIKKALEVIYKTDVGGGLTEHEYLHVFFGRYDNAPKINPKEANDWKWVSFPDLVRDVNENPDRYSNWLKLLLKGQLYNEIEKFIKESKTA